MTSTVFKGAELFVRGGFETNEIRVDSGVIVEVGRNLEGDAIVDCSGKTIIPGLFDVHTHMAYPDLTLDFNQLLAEPAEVRILRFHETARSVLSLGITTVRDAGGAGHGFEEALDRGIVVGPRMQTAITMLSMTGGHADSYMAYGADPLTAVNWPGMVDPFCDGVDSCIRKTREVIRAGARVVKISASGGFLSPNDDPQHPNFLQEEMDAIVRTAADLGVPVMAHAHGSEAIKRAIRSGVRSIEHGSYLDDEGAEMMAASGTWLVATLTASDPAEALAVDPTVPESIRAKHAAYDYPERRAFALAVESGVRIAMGTDCPVAPHGTNLRELELMSEHGLTAEQALAAATSSSAQLMGLSNELGELSPGKKADLVVVDGDPLRFSDIKDRVEQVWKEGARLV